MQPWFKTSTPPKIAVLGDLMIDAYLWGKSERISPEAPVPVVEIEKETQTLGGAGNVINNLLSLGANVVVLGIVGEDQGGDDIVTFLENKGLDTSLIYRQKDRRTSVKTRIMAAHHQMIRFDKESKDDISSESESLLEMALTTLTCDALLLSDYKKGVLTSSLTQKAIQVAQKKGIPVLVDPKGEDYSKYRGATLLTPNKKEASLATKITIDDDITLTQALLSLKEQCDLTYSMITLSEDGIGLWDNALCQIPTFAQEVYDVTGAGDTVLSALGFSLGLGQNIHEACRFANAAAAVVVAKIGSATATCDEVAVHYKIPREEGKIQTLQNLIPHIERVKKEKKRVVFTNGCFDILHAGHVRYLQEAKHLGDILVVGLNSDTSVRRLKGESRPIVTQEDRAEVLAGLESVDYVVIFNDDTPAVLIDSLLPHILVKGGDYIPENIVGYDTVTQAGGDVVVIDFLEGRSTTKIIQKVQTS